MSRYKSSENSILSLYHGKALSGTKSSGGSIRRPNAPPPPLPSAAVQGLAGTPDIPLCEHVDTIRAHLVAEQRSNLKDSRFQ